jgi:amidase
MKRSPIFDVLVTDCAELQTLLATGQLTSVDIVEAFLAQIKKHNADGLKLHAVINTTPPELALSIAKNLDNERSQGKIRGPLHGIPITIKDNIMTGPEFRMPTTIGSVALQFAMAERNAPVVDLVSSSVPNYAPQC